MPHQSAAFDVLKVLRELDEPQSEDELVQLLKSGHAPENVRKALHYLEEQGEVVRTEPDALWALAHT